MTVQQCSRHCERSEAIQYVGRDAPANSNLRADLLEIRMTTGQLARYNTGPIENQ